MGSYRMQLAGGTEVATPGKLCVLHQNSLRILARPFASEFDNTPKSGPDIARTRLPKSSADRDFTY